MVDQRARKIRTVSIWTYWLSMPVAIGALFLTDKSLFGLSVLVGLTGLAGFLWTKAYALMPQDRSRARLFFAKLEFWLLATCLAIGFPIFLVFMFRESGV
jgi:hypothetical protein